MTPGTRIRFTSPHGGRPYWICFPKTWKKVDCDGWFDQKTRRISINSELTDERKREILFHELMHFCTSPVHPPQNLEQGLEEIIVLTFEANFWRLLAKNRKLVDLLWPRKDP
jgi:hypothetical protein